MFEQELPVFIGYVHEKITSICGPIHKQAEEMVSRAN